MRMPPLPALASILSVAVLCDSVSAQQRPRSEPSIPQLIQQLGAERFAEREAADKALRSRDEAYPDLRRALSTLNAEGRRRASAILEVMDQRRAKRFLQYGREGRVDVLVEWSGLVGDRLDGEAFWQCVLDIGWNQMKRTGTSGSGRFPPRTYKQLCDDRREQLFKHNLALRDPAGLEREMLRKSLVVVTGPATSLGILDGGIVLAVGDVKIAYGRNLLIISDGDVQLDVADQTIVATRTTAASKFNDIYGGGGQPLTRSITRRKEVEQYDLLYRPGEPPRRIYNLPAPKVEEASELVEEKTAPRNDGLRFFEPEDISLSLALSNGRVMVTEVQANSPPAKAGLETDDVIVAIDGTPIGDLNTARRQLRRAFVLDGAELSISRNGKPLSIDVSFFGWELPAMDKSPEESK